MCAQPKMRHSEWVVDKNPQTTEVMAGMNIDCFTASQTGSPVSN